MNNNIDRQYLQLLKQILDFGVVKKDRTGAGTKSIFGYQIRHHMKDGFPLLTTKKMFTKGVIVELLWFLSGNTNIQSLVKQGVNIWNGDAYKKYENSLKPDTKKLTLEEFVEAINNDDEFAKWHGELGPVYGAQWTKWGEYTQWEERGQETYSTFGGATWTQGGYMMEVTYPGVNQIKQLVDDLKNNPDSRRLIVNAWNVKDIPSMTLPPCHYGFQCYTRELTLDERIEYRTNPSCLINLEDDPIDEIHETLDKEGVPARELSLMWNQRSVDTFLGLPFNIASYAFLLTMLAQQANMVPGELIGILGDTHLYLNHIEQAEEQLKAADFKLPTLELNKAADIFSYKREDFKILNYECSKEIKAPLNN